jgi:hypothetical protein
VRIPGILFITMVFIASCATMPPAPASQPFTATGIPAATKPPASALTSTSISSDTTNLEAFGSVKIDAAEIEFDVDGGGSNVDSIAFWEAPAPAHSLMFVTSKGNSSIEVYQYPFETQLTTISCGSASNGVWVDQEQDVLYIAQRDSSNVCAYDLPSLESTAALSFSTAATGGDSEPNLTMLNLPDGRRRIYVSYDNEVYSHDAETGNNVGTFSPSAGLETMYGDDYYQVIYVPDEGDRSGVYLYDQDGNPAGSKFGNRSIFDSDAEGIWAYKCLSTSTGDSGEGLIVVADQKDDSTDFEVFNRKTKDYLGKFNIDGVNNTDGIAITQQASPDYPLGLLAVIDDDTSTVGVGWDTILERTGLSCGN